MVTLIGTVTKEEFENIKKVIAVDEFVIEGSEIHIELDLKYGTIIEFLKNAGYFLELHRKVEKSESVYYVKSKEENIVEYTACVVARNEDDAIKKFQEADFDPLSLIMETISGKMLYEFEVREHL